MLNPARLRVFHEVAARGSFSAAAEVLGYTQSAVSQAVATLEAETGVTLLERARRGARPTPAGSVLLAHADAILGQMEAAEAELAALAGLRAGLLRMVSFPTAGSTLMPRAIAAFRRAHPGVELTLTEGEPEEIAPRLRAGEFDLALLFEFPGTDAPAVALRKVPLLEDPLHVVLPGDHALAGKARLRLGDLRREAWIQTSAASPCARHVVRCCHDAGFEPTVSFESDDYQTVQGLVAAGVGIALIPQLALSAVRDGVVVRALDPQSPLRTVTVATPRTTPIAPAARAMVEILRDIGRRHGGEAAALAAGVR
jgi:DNA-binding transcriptional LysR family regulator